MRLPAIFGTVRCRFDLHISNCPTYRTSIHISHIDPHLAHRSTYRILIKLFYSDFRHFLPTFSICRASFPQNLTLLSSSSSLSMSLSLLLSSTRKPPPALTPSTSLSPTPPSSSSPPLPPYILSTSPCTLTITGGFLGRSERRGGRH